MHQGLLPKESSPFVGGLIEGILYVRQTASRKAGGQGIRYVCEVEGSIAVLFHDEPYWFIEREESVSKA